MNTVISGKQWYVDPDRHCAETPEGWWFPPARASVSTTARIAAMCVGCPVRAACATDARECDDRYGIRAGVDLGHVADRAEVLAQIAASDRPGVEPIAVGRKGYRCGPAQLIQVADAKELAHALGRVS